MRQITVLAFVITCLLLPQVTFSQEQTGPLGYGKPQFTQEMQTDRPDFTEGVQAIDPGHFQLESGYTYVYDKADGLENDTHGLPEMLLRFGLVEDYELRVAWAGYILSETRDALSADNFQRSSGVSDMSLGYKHRLMSQGSEIFDLSYILELGIPVGSDVYSSDAVEPAGKILWSYALDERHAIAGNLNLANREGDNERFWESAASFTLGRDLSEDWGVYAEYFGIFSEANSVQAGSENYVNGGFTFAATDNLQLDVRSGFGLNSDAANFFSGVGLSWRI